MMSELLMFFVVGAVFVFRDAKRRGLAAHRWAGAVMCTGIVGVLLYLIKTSEHAAKDMPIASVDLPGQLAR